MGAGAEVGAACPGADVAAGICCGANVGITGAAVGSAAVPQAAINIAIMATMPGSQRSLRDLVKCLINIGHPPNNYCV